MSADRIRIVKRVYAPPSGLRTALRLSRGGMRWRQGGSGRESDISEYMRNDAKAFCLERPGESALVVCSRDCELKETIEELVDTGVCVFLCRARQESKSCLAYGMRARNVRVLRTLA